MPAEFEAQLDVTGESPEELYRKMAEAGFFGIPFPEEFGGYGGDIMDVVLAAEQFAGSSKTAINIFLVPVIFGGMLLRLVSNDAQRRASPPPHPGRAPLQFRPH